MKNKTKRHRSTTSGGKVLVWIQPGGPFDRSAKILVGKQNYQGRPPEVGRNLQIDGLNRALEVKSVDTTGQRRRVTVTADPGEFERLQGKKGRWSLQPLPAV